MDATLLGMFNTLVKPSHELKAQAPMLVTPLPNTSVPSKPYHVWKALASMALTEFGITKSPVKPEQ